MSGKKGFLVSFLAMVTAYFIFPDNVYAMHIMEGFLPATWSIIWSVITLPFIIIGFWSIQKKVRNNPGLKMLLGLAGAFAFVLSALKLPSVAGSCSHPTGVGLGAILFGPFAMSVLGVIVLLFQSLLLAHGGLTTLGANTFSMAVAGPFVAYGIYRLLKRFGAPVWVCVFMAAALGDMATYLTTSFQLALAFPSETGGVLASMYKFSAVFAVTQIPLAISEGFLTVLVMNVLTVHSKNELEELSTLTGEVKA